MKTFPVLHRYLHWLYKHKAHVYNGTSAITSHTGILQGEGCSCIVFDTGVQKILVKAGNVNHDRVGFDLHILAQRDDVYLVGAPEDVRAAYNVLIKGMAELDIEVQPAKSEIYVKNEELFHQESLSFASEFKKSTAGMIVVGSPIGSKEFIENEAHLAVDRYPAFFRRLKLMDTQNALLLLRYCGLPMATWMTRTVEPELLQKFAKKFDAEVMSTYCHIIDHKGEITPEQERWIRTPFRLGGRGLTSTEEVSPIAYYSSVTGTFEVLRRNLPDLAEEVERLKKEYEKKEILQEGEVDVSDSESVMIDDVMGEQEGEEWGLDLSQEKNAQSLVSLVERAWGVAEKQVFCEFPQKNFPAKLSEVLGDFHSYDFPSRNDIFGDSLQKTLSRGVATSRAKAAMKKLAADGKKQEIARIISQKDSGSSAAFLVAPTAPNLVLPSKTAQIAEKLGAGLVTLSGQECPCGNGKLSLDHILGCGKMRMVTIRHDLLSSIILKAMSRAGLVARGEWLVEGDTSKRMDILLFNAGKKWYDLSVANPQAPSYLNCAQKVGGALGKREKDKEAKWRKTAAKHEAHFTPIVFESTGRRSELTKELLKQIAESAAVITDEDVSTESKREHFISKVVHEITQHLSVSMAHSNALIIEEAESLAAFRSRPTKMVKRASVYGNPSFKLF